MNLATIELDMHPWLEREVLRGPARRHFLEHARWSTWYRSVAGSPGGDALEVLAIREAHQASRCPLCGESRCDYVPNEEAKRGGESQNYRLLSDGPGGAPPCTPSVCW